MCSVCNCFAWTLDLFQRALTFCLSCWLAFAVCCGLGIAVIAGIAYGYNYCMAEFITLARSDIRVYMRRGQFYDKPDLLHGHGKRRMGDDEDVFPLNLTEDYQQEIRISNEAALSNKWMRDEDSRKYAEKLTKYSEGRKTVIDVNDRAEQTKESTHKFTIPLTHHSILPNSKISTTILESGSSEIIMRMFEQVSQITETDEDEHDDTEVNRVLYKALARTTNTEEEKEEEVVESVAPDVRVQIDDRPKSELIKMRYWRTTSQPINLEDSLDVEDNIIYKSV